MSLEVERKYLHVDFPTLRAALQQAGASCAGAHFESNIVFDTPTEELFHSGRLLRLRTQEWPDRTVHILTLKLPAAQTQGFKVREERELCVAEAAGMQSVLEGLGYAPVARYEKVRETWQLTVPPARTEGQQGDGAEGHVEVVLDVLPFMNVVEMEGPARLIERVGPLLGLDKAVTSTKNYHELHQEWRSGQHLPPERSFVFTAGQGRQWRKSLNLC